MRNWYVMNSYLPNLFRKELEEDLTTEFFSVVQKEGRREVKRKLKDTIQMPFLGPDTDNAKRGFQFQEWAFYDERLSL